mgnify:CR=1 FL=1
MRVALCSLIIVLSLAMYASDSGLLRKRDRIGCLPCDAALHTGDIMLLGSDTWRGRLLLALDDDSEYVHIGLVEVCSNKVFLIHADPAQGGVVRDALRDYLKANDAERIKVLRVKTDRDTVNAAMIFARRQWIEKKTFDNSFRYRKGKGFYCTEIVLRAYDSAGIKLLPDVKDGDRIFPSEVIKSGCVSKIAEWGRPK